MPIKGVYVPWFLEYSHVALSLKLANTLDNLMTKNCSDPQPDAASQKGKRRFSLRQFKIKPQAKVAMIVASILMLGSTATVASFSGSANANVSVSAGSININLDGNQGSPTAYTLPLPSTQFSPGVTTTKTVALNNTGTLPVVVSMNTATSSGASGLASKLTGNISMTGGGSYSGALRNASFSGKVIPAKSTTNVTFTITAPTTLAESDQDLSDSVEFTFNAVVQGSEVPPVAWTDTAKTRTTLTSSKWVTKVCVLWSREDQAAGNIFTLTNSAPLGSLGWTSIVDKSTATTTAELSECHLAILAGEAWSASAESFALAEQYYAQGGKVISTGNDTGTTRNPFPQMITAVGEPTQLFLGGNVRNATGANALTPKFPAWETSPADRSDSTGNPIMAYPAGVQCIANVSGQPTWCAAVARTNANKGRWVHLHTMIGSLNLPGDLPMTDAAITWLAAP